MAEAPITGLKIATTATTGGYDTIRVTWTRPTKHWGLWSQEKSGARQLLKPGVNDPRVINVEPTALTLRIPTGVAWSPVLWVDAPPSRSPEKMQHQTLRLGRTPRAQAPAPVKPAPAPATPKPAPAPRKLSRGVHLHAMWSNTTPELTDEALRRIAAAGGDRVRIDVGWESVEPARGQWSDYHLGRLDQAVDSAATRGVRPLLSVADTAMWASGQKTTKTLPKDPATFAHAMAVLVTRYRGRVDWEFYNEPNAEWSLNGPDKARRYVEALKLVYPAIKASDPDTTVVAGAVMECDAAFLDALYLFGMKDFCDAVSIHPYSHDRSPLDPRLSAADYYPAQSFITGVPAMRAVMLKHGHTAPMWLTELGWSTCARRDPKTPWINGVDQDVRARYLRDAITQAAKWDYVAAIFAYAWWRRPDGPDDFLGCFSMTTPTGADTDAVAALAA